VLIGISIFFCLLSTPFLPASKEQCAEWQARGERAGSSSARGYFSLIIAAFTIIVSYHLTFKIPLLLYLYCCCSLLIIIIIISIIFVICISLQYGGGVSILLLIPSTSCEAIVGGSGC